MLAIGSASIAEMLSLRRVHSPAASSASANRPPSSDAHAGAEQAGLDRIAHHEEAAERQRQSADPDHPACADGFLETGRRVPATAEALRYLPARRVRLLPSVRLGLRRQRRRFGRHFRRRRREGPLRLLQRRKRWRQRACRSRRFERLHAPAQRCSLVERLECQDERDDGDHERQEEVERGIEHSVSSEHDCGSRPAPDAGRATGFPTRIVLKDNMPRETVNRSLPRPVAIH